MILEKIGAAVLFLTASVQPLLGDTSGVDHEKNAAINLVSGAAVIEWDTLDDVDYHLEWSTNLVDWELVENSERFGNGARLSHYDSSGAPGAGMPRRFYRIVATAAGSGG